MRLFGPGKADAKAAGSDDSASDGGKGTARGFFASLFGGPAKEKKKEGGKQKQQANKAGSPLTPSRLTIVPRAPSAAQRTAGKVANPLAGKKASGHAKQPPLPNHASSSSTFAESVAMAPPMSSDKFFTEYGEANRYALKEVIGKGSYGVVCSAVDNHTGKLVAIKKINDVFDHVSDATRILREIKLVRHLKHPDVVEILHILLPPSKNEFKDIYVIFELMETDLHQVIKANDDLTHEHHQFFLYQLLRGMKYIHSANVYHRDLKPKNILANADCSLKICDFGLARPQFNDQPSTVFWTDYVATRWYRAPELCGSFFARYSPAVDIWSIGCIFAEILNGKPLFPGRNVVHQLELITDLLGTPDEQTLAKVRNDKARRFLQNMPHKPGANFAQHFPNAAPGAIKLLRRLLAFDADLRPSAEEALRDPYFQGLSAPDREPSAEPIDKLEYEFDRRKLTAPEVRELIYREILHYHPNTEKDYLDGGGTNFMYPSAVDNFKRQFDSMEESFDTMGAPGPSANAGSGSKPLTRGAPGMRTAMSLPRERVRELEEAANEAVMAIGADAAPPATSPGDAAADGAQHHPIDMDAQASGGTMAAPGLHPLMDGGGDVAMNPNNPERFLRRCDST